MFDRRHASGLRERGPKPFRGSADRRERGAQHPGDITITCFGFGIVVDHEYYGAAGRRHQLTPPTRPAAPISIEDS